MDSRSLWVTRQTHSADMVRWPTVLADMKGVSTDAENQGAPVAEAEAAGPVVGAAAAFEVAYTAAMPRRLAVLEGSTTVGRAAGASTTTRVVPSESRLVEAPATKTG